VCDLHRTLHSPGVFQQSEEEEGILHNFLEYQHEELEIMLPWISEESLRILEERARELQMNWLIPGENEEVSTRPRAGTPYPRSDTQPTPPTYQDRGVSPFHIAEREGKSVCLDYKDLNDKLREYERELQTLHVIQNKPEVQSAVVKGTRVALLFLYLHRPARQGEVFASLFIKPPTTGAASAESYDLYSQRGVLRILSRNYAYERRVEVT
jgi:hypothetical protein